MALLNDEQVMLRDMAREWADNESPITAFRKMRDAAPAFGFDIQSAAKQAEMGWFGVTIPEAFGGSAFGFLSLGLVLEQLGRNLVASPLGASAVAATVIAESASDEIKAKWLPRLATGEIVATLAVDEGPIHDPAKIATKAESGKLTGDKAFVAEGDAAKLFLVAATDGLYLVADGAGVTKSTRRMADSRSHAMVSFKDAAAEKLGGPDLTARAIDLATVAATAEMLGMAEAAFAQTLDYLKQRVQFGQVLSTFQALQHRMAKMFTELQLMRSVVEAALEAVDAKRSDLDQAASLAKAVAGETLRLVSREMVQLHGGVGMTDEYDPGLYLKRSAVIEAMWGTAAYHRDRFGRLNGY